MFDFSKRIKDDIDYSTNKVINNLYSKVIDVLDKGDSDCIEYKCIHNNIYNELSKIATYEKLTYNNNTELIDKIATKYNCINKTLICVLYKLRDELNKVNDYNVDLDLIQKSINDAKQPGPFDSKKWFSNDDIDNVLKKFETMFKDKNFFHIYFHMRDFKTKNNYNDEKRNINLIDFVEKYKKNYKTFGVVFNTDVSSGSGEHWFCLFCNFYEKPFTVEYFNSSGETPSVEISELMCDIKHKMTKFFSESDISVNINEKKNDYGDIDNIIKCSNSSDDNYIRCIQSTKLINQKDNHSCGSYSIFYIFARLNGISYKEFKNNIIGDNLMHKFRNKLFAHNY